MRPAEPTSRATRELPPDVAGRALPDAGRETRLRVRGASGSPDEVRFTAPMPSGAVARTVRRDRARGARIATLVLVVALAVAAGLTRLTRPEAVHPSSPPPPWRQALDVALAAPIGVSGPIRPPAPRAVPQPGPVTVLLPDAHRFTGWRLLCFRGGALEERSASVLTSTSDRVFVASVPPADCRLVLVGAGAMSVRVTAGSTLACASPETQSCRHVP